MRTDLARTAPVPAARHEVELTVPPRRFRSALKAGSRSGLLPAEDRLVFAMPAEAVRRAVKALVFLMLAPELSWIEERDIACTLRLTEADGTFVFLFERQADAELFRSVWCGESGATLH